MLIKTGFFGAFIGAIMLLGASATPASAFVVGPPSGPTTPGKWGPGSMGTGATVTWSLMGAGVISTNSVDPFTSVSLGSFMPSGFEAVIESAFDAWSAVANVTFVQILDFGEAFNAPQQSGDIRLGGHFIDGAFNGSTGGALAHAFFPPPNGDSAAGDIHFDKDEPWKIGFDGSGFDIFQVAAHEIGHAIGLGHELSIANSLMNPFYTEAFSGPQADDIAGARFIYGAALAVVPLPAALPLFGSAMVVMGLVGWRRKRKAAA